MYCKNCGKEIKDGVLYCPMCGKSTGVTEQGGNRESSPKKKKPNPKFIIGIMVVVMLIFIVGIIGKKLSSLNDTQSVADIEEFSEDFNEENYDTGQNNPDDKKWAKNKSYKKAYKEEYASFEKRLQEYCEQSDIEYMETVDEYAEQIDKAYKSIEKAIPGLSDKIAKDISSNAESELGSAILEKVAGAAISNEKVRKTAYKTTMIVATSLFDYMMNYTTTNYPFGFELLALNGDYALLRSAGTYDDMLTITRNSMFYDIKLEMIQERILELEEALDTQDKDEDEYAEYMGMIAANRTKEKEVKELFYKCMTSIACGGNYYCPATNMKLYWVVHKDGTVYNTFWAPSTIGAEDSTFNITISNKGDCFLESPEDRFVIDRTGKIIFEGNSFNERENEEVGESIICTYGPSGNALRETKVKDSTYGTYYAMELVKKNGKTKKLLNMRDYTQSFGSPCYPSTTSAYGWDSNLTWNEDSMNCSDFTLLQYTSLENQEEAVVIDLSSGEMYSREDFENTVQENNSKEIKANQKLAGNGTPKSGWIYNAYNNQLYVINDSVTLEFLGGLSDSYVGLNTLDAQFEFDTETLLKNIGESREISDWYCQNNLLWIVTRSGYFYTYDLKSKKKNPEVEIGESALHAFTPYGLMVYDNNKEEIFKNSSDKEAEYSVFQYDASGKQIGKYPTYFDEIRSLGGYVYDFLYYSGKDIYNLTTKEIISLE